jgi:hypothetical protein
VTFENRIDPDLIAFVAFISLGGGAAVVLRRPGSVLRS